MSAQSAVSIRRSSARVSRPVIDAPGLSVVLSPLPSRGYFRTTLVCGLIFLGAISGAFALNTAMIQGAYEIKSTTVELNEVKADVESLREEVARLETPATLNERAKGYEMVPAEEIRHIDLAVASTPGAVAAADDTATKK